MHTVVVIEHWHTIFQNNLENASFYLLNDYFKMVFKCLQWFDTVGWAIGRASGL